MENMRFKVGDRVRIKSIDWYFDNRDGIDEVACGNTNFIPDMVKYCERIVTISSVLPTLEVYHIKEDGGMFNWTDEMIEGLAYDEEIEFTEEDKYWCDIMSESDPTTYVLPQGYQFVDENGNVINATKIILEKKKKEYPKTFLGCCDVLGIEDTISRGVKGYKSNLLDTFQKLLICRDAYWKIAGDEMGLGKPWEPSDSDYITGRYCIFVHRGNIICDTPAQDCILTFPTEEMRDAFYENFKEEIESYKELL